MALILGEVVDVLVTACGFLLLLKLPPLASCPVGDSVEIRLLIRFRFVCHETRTRHLRGLHPVLHASRSRAGGRADRNISSAVCRASGRSTILCSALLDAIPCDRSEKL